MSKTLSHHAGHLRKGHASHWLRTAFHSLLDEYWNTDAPLPESFDVEGEAVPVRWLVGQLWNCTDTLPSNYVEMLELHKATTYAAAAHKLLDELRTKP
jgi:hypothetical protein